MYKCVLVETSLAPCPTIIPGLASEVFLGRARRGPLRPAAGGRGLSLTSLAPCPRCAASLGRPRGVVDGRAGAGAGT